MVRIGEKNRLKVVKQVDFGFYLDGGDDGRILLPRRYVPVGTELGVELDVFIYLDSGDELIATTEVPKVMVGQCAYLQVKDVNAIGAFVDWGLPKDLLVPYSEQSRPLRVGDSCVVCVYLDSTDRIAASTRLERHLFEEARYLKPGQKVELLIWGRSDMGYKAVVNQRNLGLIFRDDAFRPLRIGEKTSGYIKAIRADGKIDLSLQLQSQQGRDSLSEQIIAHLKAAGGTSQLTDKTPPEVISRQFGVSKGSYKKALGALYKARRIDIGADRITLLDT